MYYINTDCTYTKIAIEQLLREKYFDDKCHCNNIKIYDLRFLKIEDVAYRLIQLFKETLKQQLKSWEGLEDTPTGKKEIRKIEHLIEECDDWCDDETEFEEG